MESTRQVTRLEYSVYTTGIAGQNILYNFMSMYAMFFFTDLLKISSTAATAIVFLASIWDAFNDPMMGLIADKTKTRIGKFRPYLLGGSVLVLITTILVYTKLGSTPQQTVVFAAIIYILWGMSFTISDIPIWALSSVASNIPSERNKMISFGKIGGTIGVVLCVIFSVQLLNYFGGEREMSAYFNSAVIVGFIAFLSIFFTGLFIKERIKPVKETVKIKENIKTVSKNKSLIHLIVLLFIMNAINSVRQVSQLYFTVYTWGDSNQVTNVGIALVIGMIVGIGSTNLLMSKFEKKSILITTGVLGAIFSLIPYIDLSNILLGIVSLGFSFTTIGVMIITSTSMLLDAIDYSEWNLGFRGEGIVFSLNTFVTKLGAAFAKLMLGIGLILINYVDNQPVTTETIQTFSAFMYLIPALLSLLTIIPLLFYRLDKETMNNVQKDLTVRRETQWT